MAAPAGCLSLGAGGQSWHPWRWGCSIGKVLPGSLHVPLLQALTPTRILQLEQRPQQPPPPCPGPQGSGGPSG